MSSGCAAMARTLGMRLTFKKIAEFGGVVNEVQFEREAMIARQRALALLSECTGETLWPVEHCVIRGVPQVWIDELAAAFESGFENDRDTIYRDEVDFAKRRATNQFHGVRDVDLAIRLGESLGVDVAKIRQFALGRAAVVEAIKQAVMEGE